MGRRAAREIALKLLYQLEIQKDNREEQIEFVLDESTLGKNDKQYITSIIDGVFSNVAHIDGIIEKYSKGWKLGRLSKVDLSILRLSIFEIGFRDDIPFSVSVNEAVELAKRYSSEEAGSFVNGILSKLAEPEIEAVPEDKLVDD